MVEIKTENYFIDSMVGVDKMKGMTIWLGMMFATNVVKLNVKNYMKKTTKPKVKKEVKEICPVCKKDMPEHYVQMSFTKYCSIQCVLNRKLRKTDKKKKNDCISNSCLLHPYNSNTLCLKHKEQIYEEIIALVKSLDHKRKYHPKDEPCKIEQNESIHTDLDFKAGIDRNLICSHCRYRVVDCMGKCKTELFKGTKAELKKVKESTWSKIKNFRLPM